MRNWLECLKDNPVFLFEVVAVILNIIFLIVTGITNAELSEYNSIENPFQRALSMLAHDNGKAVGLFLFGIVLFIVNIVLDVAMWRKSRLGLVLGDNERYFAMMLVSLVINTILCILLFVFLNNPIAWAIFTVAVAVGILAALNS